MDCEIDEDSGGATAPQGFVELHDRAFALHKLVSGLFAQALEDPVEERVLEFLGNDRCHQPAITRGKTEPFKVPVMTSRDNARTGRANGAGKLLPTDKLNVLRPVLGVDPRVPKEIDHGAGKLLIRLARDPGALRGGKTIAEDDFEIIERHSAPFAIEVGGECAGDARESHRRPTRESGNEKREQSHTEPFEAMPDRFPGRPHRSVIVRQGLLRLIGQPPGRPGFVDLKTINSTLALVVAGASRIVKNVLFVCTGNICRSPMALGLFRRLLGNRKDIEADAAGVHAVRGQPPSIHAVEVLRKHGVDISGFRSQPLTAMLVERATHIFAMTGSHLETIHLLFPESMEKTFLLREFEQPGATCWLDLPDPIGMSREVYQECANCIEKALPSVLAFVEETELALPRQARGSGAAGSNLQVPHQMESEGEDHSMHSSDKSLRRVDPEVTDAIGAEERRQRENIELIASENFTSRAVMEAQGSCLTNKYAEGYPAKRWYGGCENVDVVEQLAIDRAKKIFGAEHVNVQPHSGAQANMAVYFSVLKPGDRILTMNLAHGGHLTHGHPANFSGRLYQVTQYGVSQETEQIDYDALAKLAEEVRPAMITAGASAYPRFFDFARLRQIADSVDALLFIDMAHIAGLVAGGEHPSPVPYAQFVTTTTHKSLRGPRGGIVLCQEKFAKAIDASVFPGVQGGPLMHVIAAKAVCFHEALQPEFRDYQHQVVLNAKALAAGVAKHGFRIVSGGTDNHLMLVDLRPKEINGRDAQNTLDRAGITVNKNAIPFDTYPIFKPGGIRLGTPAVTTRGMKEEEMLEIAELLAEALDHRDEENAIARVRQQVQQLTRKFPLPG